MIKTEIYFVEGMTCASCVAKVESAIKNIAGVNEVVVNLATEKVKIQHNEVLYEKIEKAVTEIGYKIHKISSEKNTIELQKINFKKLKFDFFLSVALTIPVFLISMFSMNDWFMELVPIGMQNLNYIVFALTTILLFTSGKRFFINAYKLMLKLSSDMNTLTAIGTGSAYLYSTSILFFPDFFSNLNQETNHFYYDTTAVIITLILFGKFFESKAKMKMIGSISSLVSLQPKTAHILKENIITDVETDFVKNGEIFLVKPGEKIPFDGIIINGFTSIDESMITGESMLVEKKSGDKIIGGTINFQGSIEAKVTATGKNSLLAHIIEHVENAQSSKTKIQSLADTIVSVFVPTVILISISTFLIWSIVIGEKFEIALINSIAVLIIACPCALGLATPTAIIVATGKSASKGILIKNAESLERACNIETVVFDKTGTLTEGKLVINEIKTFNLFNDDFVYSVILSIERLSTHPIATAITKHLNDKNISTVEIKNFEAKIGFGSIGFFEEKKILIGSEKLMIENNISFPVENENKNNTIVYLAIENKLSAKIFLSDKIVEKNRDVISDLKSNKVDVMMLSGDLIPIVSDVAEKLGIKRFMAMVSPTDKNKIIKDLQSKKEIVAMVGDGINDAPALAQADVSIALGRGTEIAMDTADITLMKSDLSGVLEIINISRETIKTIKQNLFWAFIYNVLSIPLAAIGFLNPQIASFTMAFSSVSVLLNSLRIKLKK